MSQVTLNLPVIWTLMLILFTVHTDIVFGQNDKDTNEWRRTCDGSIADCRSSDAFNHGDYTEEASWRYHDEFDLDLDNIEDEVKTEVRLVLAGRTGEGKSSTANTIIGEKYFKAKTMAKSVTKNADFIKQNVQGRELLLVDTPGLFDTDKMNNETLLEIGKSLLLSSPGPHAFLLVFSTQRVTEEIKNSIELMKKAFGDELLKHSILVFTRKDDLDHDGITIKQFLRNVPDYMKKLLKACDNRYVAFNNRLGNEESQEQIRILLKMLDDLIKVNKGKHFASEQYNQIEANIKRMEEERIREIEDDYKKRSAPMREKIREMEETLDSLTEDNEKQIRMRKRLEDKLKEERKRLDEEKGTALEKRGRVRESIRHDIKEEGCVNCIIAAGIVGGVVLGGAFLTGSVGAATATGVGFVVGSTFYYVANLFS